MILIENSVNECTYCLGARLVGWSGAGPLLCPECSSGKDPFDVITRAWREQRREVSRLTQQNHELKEEVHELKAELRAFIEDVKVCLKGVLAVESILNQLANNHIK